MNVLGGSALGTFITSVFSYWAQLFSGTGSLSSFTAYSAFAVQTTSLSSVGDALNVDVNCVLGLTAAALGLIFGERR